MEDGLVVAGIAIPSRDPVFLAILAAHVPAGVVAAIAGACAAVLPKRAGRHPSAGAVYTWALAVLLLTGLALTAFRPGEDAVFAALGALAFGAAIAGRRVRRAARPGWLRVHLVAMSASFVLMLTAFYVDNAHNLPLWRDLPTWAVWTLPSAVGAPLVARAWWRYRPHQA